MQCAEPRASILINNYNNGRYIADCVASALDQTAPAAEVIVYDDGSTDESLGVLRSFGDRITLIEGVHDSAKASRLCQAEAVWRAFQRSRGEWLFLLDGDARFERRKVERVLRFVASRTDIALVQSPLRLIDENGREFGRYRDLRFHHPRIGAAIYEQDDVDFFYPTSAMVVNRRALERVLPLDMTICPELACDTRIGMLMPLLGEVMTMFECLGAWRRHAGSYISGLGRSRWFQAQQTWRRVRTFNRCAPRYSAKPISLWRNRRFRRQLLGAMLPESLRRRWRKTDLVFHGPRASASALRKIAP
ncbi:MAG TPA: glycosyltransferase family A protein [Opitutus sp.]|nr:glycosyltransferase family A protein [Opitutus sp.]